MSEEPSFIPVSNQPLSDSLANLIAATDPTLADRLTKDPDAYLDLIALASSTRAQSDNLMSAAILAARHAGCTWDQIGTALGTSRQAAQQAYSKHIIEPDTTQTGTPQRMLARPLTAFNEMGFLAIAGRYGWHSIAYGVAYHMLERDTNQWEHARTSFGNIPFGSGWQRIGLGWGWWQYWARRLDTPALIGDPSLEDMLRAC